MNDRFKFRVWSYEQKRMINSWDYSSKRDFLYGALIDHRFFGNGLFITMQSTGMKDKNGKLIYGKDIIRFYFDNDEIIAVIEWDNDVCRFYLNTTDYFKDKYVTDYEIVKQEEYEIIGNIYENKELLESEG